MLGAIRAANQCMGLSWRTILTGYGALICNRNPNAGFLYEMTASSAVQITSRAVERRYVLCFKQPDGRYRVMGSVYYRGDGRCDREANNLAMEMPQSLVLTPRSEVMVWPATMREFRPPASGAGERELSQCAAEHYAIGAIESTWCGKVVECRRYRTCVVLIRIPARSKALCHAML